LDKLVVQSIMDYKKAYKELPEDIIFYRMGLSVE